MDPFKVKPLTEEQILAARRRRSKEWCARSCVCAAPSPSPAMVLVARDG